MKNLLSVFILCTSLLSFSQDIKRENVKGKIVVEGNDIEGIVIYNASSETGTVTNAAGEFKIDLALNDLLEIRALQYQNIDVKISEPIVESKQLSVFLIEEINKLDEVVVTNRKLTGNIKADLSKVKTFTPKSNIVYFGMQDKTEYKIDTNKGGKIENTAVHSQAQTMIHGLNIVNVVDQLLIPLFRSEVEDKSLVGVPEVPAEAIKYYFGSNFLVENFKIPEHRVEEFIRYVEDEKFDFDLLNYGHEIEFLELLSQKSKTFLKTKSSTE